MGYMVKIFLDGVHWDSSYTCDRNEAEEWKQQLEDKNVSIWDRVNHSALNEYIVYFNVIDAEKIEVTVDIC